jgi:hypothetical protein
LRWLAARLPTRILPDDLTALGVIAAFGVAVAYQLAQRLARLALGRERPAGGAVVRRLARRHGARVRGIERPTYGFYLDHLVDAIATAAIGIGLGLSPLMLLSIGTLIVVASTEVRLILNTVVALGVGLDFEIVDLRLTVFDLIGLAIAAAMLALLCGRAVRNLRELGRREPPAPRR